MLFELIFLHAHAHRAELKVDWASFRDEGGAAPLHLLTAAAAAAVAHAQSPSPSFQYLSVGEPAEAEN